MVQSPTAPGVQLPGAVGVASPAVGQGSGARTGPCPTAFFGPRLRTEILGGAEKRPFAPAAGPILGPKSRGEVAHGAEILGRRPAWEASPMNRKEAIEILRRAGALSPAVEKLPDDALRALAASLEAAVSRRTEVRLEDIAALHGRSVSWASAWVRTLRLRPRELTAADYIAAVEQLPAEERPALASPWCADAARQRLEASRRKGEKS